MRKRSMAFFLCAFPILCATQTGCLVGHSQHTVIRQAEPLYHVAFQSENAKLAFEDHVRNKLENDDNQSHSSFAVPFLLGLQKSQKLSENAVRNDTAAQFDSNADGMIDDRELSLGQ